MKKTVVCLSIVSLLLLDGCRYYQISVDAGTKWASAEQFIYLEIVDGTYATGTFTFNGVQTDIKCIFGPGPKEFTVFPLLAPNENIVDGDSWLFRGDYHYNKKDNTIVLTIVEDQADINVKEIILKEE